MGIYWGLCFVKDFFNKSSWIDLHSDSEYNMKGSIGPDGKRLPGITIEDAVNQYLVPENLITDLCYIVQCMGDTYGNGGCSYRKFRILVPEPTTDKPILLLRNIPCNSVVREFVREAEGKLDKCWKRPASTSCTFENDGIRVTATGAMTKAPENATFVERIS